MHPHPFHSIRHPKPVPGAPFFFIPAEQEGGGVGAAGAGGAVVRS